MRRRRTKYLQHHPQQVHAQLAAASLAVIGAILVVYTLPILPYALAFAAGAMIYIVIEEVVPESQQDNYTDTSTIGFIIGFVIMMILDTSLG